VLIILHDVDRVILGRLLLVCDVEIEAGVVTLDRLEKRFKSISEATLTQRSTARVLQRLERTILGRFALVGCPVHPFVFYLPWVVACGRWMAGTA